MASSKKSVSPAVPHSAVSSASRASVSAPPPVEPISAVHHRWARPAFIALAALLFVLMPILSLKHGQSGDEWSLVLYGHDIYDYFFHGSKKALDYDALNWLQVEGLHYYGGLYDFIITFIYEKLFSSTDELTFRHVVNALVGAALFLYTGLIGKEIGGWRVGFFALLFIALSPRLFGESMNNPKDIPFAFANVFFLYYLIRFLRSFPKRRWKYAVLMGVGLGMAMGFRIGGIIVLPYTALFTALYYLWNRDFKARMNADFSGMAKKFVLALLVTLAIGWGLGIIFWPWALQSPVGNPLAALAEMTNRNIPLPVLFEGEYISNMDVPWYYTPKWIFMSNPLVILGAAVGGVAVLRTMMGRYGRWEVFVLLFTLVFPWAYAVYKHSTIHDTWRHFFFLYPSLVVLAALFCNWALEMLQSRRNMQWAFVGVISVGLALPLAFTIRNYPHEYVYFNEAIGGANGAKGMYDLDYYQNGGKEMSDWIKQQPASAPGRKTIVRSNLSAIEKYFTRDTARYNAGYLRYEIRDTAEWDYYISYSRYQPAEDLEADRWPPKDAAYIIRVDGVPIGAVLKRKSNESVYGYRALTRQDYPAAARHFEEYLKVDPQNGSILAILGELQAAQGQYPQALQTLQRAKAADPANPRIDEVMGAIQNNMRGAPPAIPQQ